MPAASPTARPLPARSSPARSPTTTVPPTPTPSVAAYASRGPGPCIGGIIGAPIYEHFLQWSPDGSQILFDFSLNKYGVAPFALYAVETRGSKLRKIVTERENSNSGEGAIWEGGYMMHFGISPDGSRVAYSTCRYPSQYRGHSTTHFFEIAVANIDGTGKRRITENSYYDNYPVWSPAGDRIAFVSDRHNVTIYGNRKAIGQLTIYEVATGESREISSSLGDRVAPYPPAWSPTWSPDGERIAFVAFEDYRPPLGLLPCCRELRAVYTIRPDGSDLNKISDAYSEPSWSPVGTRIALIVPDAGGASLYTFTPTGGNPLMVARILDDVENPDLFWAGSVSWSPDGSRILYTCNGICAVNLEDGSRVEISPDNEVPAYWNVVTAWSPDGSRIAVRYGSRTAVEAIPWSSFAEGEILLYTMSPDGTDAQVLVRYSDGALISESSWKSR